MQGDKDGFAAVEVDSRKVLVEEGFEADDLLVGLQVCTESGVRSYCRCQLRVSCRQI